MEYGYPALVMAAGIFCAVVAGFFLAFSGCVMGALSKRPAAEAISAMQAINVVVINPVIMTFLFGTAALGVALIGLTITRTTTTAGLWVITGGVIYLVGVVITTVAGNVPLNNSLEAVEPDTVDGARIWSEYADRWTRWNHLRTFAAFAAGMSYGIALLRMLTNGSLSR